MSKKKKAQKSGHKADVKPQTHSATPHAPRTSAKQTHKQTQPPKEANMTQNNTQNTTKAFEKLNADATAFGQENLDAMIQSSTLFFKGAENLMKTCATLTQESAQKNAEALQTLMSCKTLNELTETQNQLAQDSFDGFIAQATKLSELSLKLAKESLEPINAQVTRTVKRAKDSAAA